MAKPKSVELDEFFTPARVLKANPFASLQALGVAANAILGAFIVGASLPTLTAKLAADGTVNGTTAYTNLNPATLGGVVKAFNDILAVLDADSGVEDEDYVELLTATGATLYAKYLELLAKLDAEDLGDSNYGATVNATWTGFLSTPLDG